MGQVLRYKHFEALYGQICPRCGGHRIIDNESVPESLQKEAERIARGIFNGTITEGTIDPVMTKLVAEELRKAAIEGFGKDYPKVNYGTPDYKMLSSLELNIFHFSGAENFQMLKSMSLALRDENGMLRSEKDFKKEAGKIAGTYLGRNFKTEYQTAVASSQMAGKWVEFEKNKTAAPWLRYDTVGDSRVRPEHKKLDGVIKKVEDPFWNFYYPPNGWGCRCDVTQLVHGAETPSDRIQLPNDIPQMFQTNMAKDGIVFPNGHPYYTGLPDNIKAKAAALRTPQYSQAYPAKGKTKKGGKVDVSSMSHQEDLKYNLEKSQQLADSGEHVKVRPHIDAQFVKNPELELYNGTQLGDFKQPAPKSNYKNSYEHQIKKTAAQKSQIPILVFDKTNYKKAELIRALNNDLMWKSATVVTEVWLMFDSNLIKITREEITLKTYYSKLPE